MGQGVWDIAIVGGGIIGLATALHLLERHPALALVVLEKEPAIGQHQTGHNSGVLHSGIYYAPGSLKARLCVAGKASLQRFCDERGIAYELCGKVIVATDQAEVPRLEHLYQRGASAGEWRTSAPVGDRPRGCWREPSSGSTAIGIWSR